MTGTEQVLINDWCQQFPSHSIGSLAFGPDGALYVSGGEARASTSSTTARTGIPLNPVRRSARRASAATQTPPTAEGGALRSQDLRTTGDPVGARRRGPPHRSDDRRGDCPDNPLVGSTDANARRIVAYGLRNPFRFTFRPGTNEIWVGDVGWNTWEEIDRIANADRRVVANFGWPCYEGVGRSQVRRRRTSTSARTSTTRRPR